MLLRRIGWKFVIVFFCFKKGLQSVCLCMNCNFAAQPESNDQWWEERSKLREHRWNHWHPLSGSHSPALWYKNRKVKSVMLFYLSLFKPFFFRKRIMVEFKINEQLVGLICVWIFNIPADNLTNVCRACIQWLEGIRPPAIFLL